MPDPIGAIGPHLVSRGDWGCDSAIGMAEYRETPDFLVSFIGWLLLIGAHCWPISTDDEFQPQQHMVRALPPVGSHGLANGLAQPQDRWDIEPNETSSRNNGLRYRVALGCVQSRRGELNRGRRTRRAGRH